MHSSSCCVALLLILHLGCSDAGETGSSAGSGGDSSTASSGEGGSGAAGSGSTGAPNSSSTSSSSTSSSGVGGDGGLGPSFCPDLDPPTEAGFDVGDQLANLVVKDCQGNDVSLEAFCGAEGLWIFAAHGWCPLCQSVSGNQEAILSDYPGLVAINVIVEDGQGETPDADYCELWRASHGHSEVYTLFDPTGSVLALWPGGSSSLSAFVDKDRIVRSKLDHESNEALIRAEIEASLTP